MGKIYYIPLENLEQRYSGMMNYALRKHFDCADIIDPLISIPFIENGQFLDISFTIKYKAAQLGMIADMFAKGKVKDGDVFLVADMFFPGIESIKYMAELLGIKVFLAGFNYAGRADKNDFVRKLGKWADSSEQGYHDVFDIVFVGSDYHKDQVCAYFKLPQQKVCKTGYIWDKDYIDGLQRVTASKMTGCTIWPHRPCIEKGVDEFLSYAAENLYHNFIVTSCGKPDVGFASCLPVNVEYVTGLSKAAYYGYMNIAENYLSTAYQETFGYTLQEAIHFGCRVAVPNRACYPEMVPLKNLYSDISEINGAYHHVPGSYTDRWDNNAETIMRILKNHLHYY